MSSSLPTFALVVEIEMYAISDRTPPSQPVSDESWKAHFDACAVDVGLDYLTPIAESQILHLVTNLDDHALDVLARYRVDELAADYIEAPAASWTAEQVRFTVGGLMGGVAILGPSGERLSHPGCCSDLGGLLDWVAVLEARSPEWEYPWNGHDAEVVGVRWSGDAASFEFDISGRSKPRPLRCVVSAREMDEAVVRMRSDAADLARRLEDILTNVARDSGARGLLAQTMAGLERG